MEAVGEARRQPLGLTGDRDLRVAPGHFLDQRGELQLGEPRAEAAVMP
ncbi:MAG: hypothetical protein Q8R44_08180 [Novosphingobium sp.]|nr:hypothetical protein [Novosphingobium sp.]